MSNTIKIKKGIDIQLKGEAEKVLERLDVPEFFALKPTDFFGLTPKLAVKVGDKVKAGTPLIYDKYQTEVKYASPWSGEVSSINRGERRKILEVVIKADKKNSYESFIKANPLTLSRDEVKKELLKSGLWPYIKMRPYGIVARPKDTPKNIFISCFSSAPLAPDYDYIINGEENAWQTGIDALSKLTNGKIHLGLPAEGANKIFVNTRGVDITYYEGPHPAGNVGVQINAKSPINKGDVLWTLQPQGVISIGRLFKNGIHDSSRIIALTGSEVKGPRYYRTWGGASILSIVSGDKLTGNNVRIISGDALTGQTVQNNGFLGFYNSLVSVIPEGNYYEAFGWALPGFKKFSVSRCFFSWLMSKKKRYTLDSNLHGEERAFVVSGEYEKFLPFDILPAYLLKAILINNIDRMEQLGIYEVIEEDLALCEYACTSKINVQDILRKGINLMIKEVE